MPEKTREKRLAEINAAWSKAVTTVKEPTPSASKKSKSTKPKK